MVNSNKAGNMKMEVKIEKGEGRRDDDKMEELTLVRGQLNTIV